jgi:2-polyprenyl-6-methoxyphenol hydroxylase-like FAD-dependent oxidoreductase
MYNDSQSTVHRAKFLDEFVALVPKEICHFGKRLETVEEKKEGGVRLSFKDGTTAEADCVFGADGKTCHYEHTLTATLADHSTLREL